MNVEEKCYGKRSRRRAKEDIAQQKCRYSESSDDSERISHSFLFEKHRPYAKNRECVPVPVLLAVMLLVAAHCSLCFLVLCCLRGNVIWANVVNIGVIFFLSVWAIEKMEFTRKTIEGKLFWYYRDYVVQDILLSKGFLAEILYSIAVFAAASIIGLFAVFMQKKIGGRRMGE